MTAIPTDSDSVNFFKYATPIRRLGAHCIDWVVVNTIGAALLSLFCLNFYLFLCFFGLIHLYTMIPATPVYGFLGEVYCFGRGSDWPTVNTIRFIMGFSLMIDCLYFVSMESSKRQATLGKQFFRIQVVDYKGALLTRKKAFLRYGLKGIGALFLFAGRIGPPEYFIYPSLVGLATPVINLAVICFMPKVQGMHDVLAKTVCLET